MEKLAVEYNSKSKCKGIGWQNCVVYLAAAAMSCTVVSTTVPPPPAHSQGKKYKCLEIRVTKNWEWKTAAIVYVNSYM